MSSDPLILLEGSATDDGGACAQSAKELGAYYTDAQIADFLLWWALRRPVDRVMDPSFGGGVFLRSACKRLKGLGGDPVRQVYGVELDCGVYGEISGRLKDEFGVSSRNLVQSDFFDLDVSKGHRMDVVVGNPPFIRYHRFHGNTRSKALKRAQSSGVMLNQLTSSWAPFLVHSAAHVQQGGRLAMVVPMELVQAAYAKPVLGHLKDSFGRVTLLTFRRKLFPDLSEDTLLVLAEDKGRGPARLLWRDLHSAGSLTEIRRRNHLPIYGTRRIDAEELAGGRLRFVELLLPARVRDLYASLVKEGLTRRLGEFADVGIGYVTGCNDFFHLSPAAAADYGIPSTYLRRAVRRARALRGVKLTLEDWHTAAAAGDAEYLLLVARPNGLPDSVRRYIESGERQGVQRAYKCRTRSPWFKVPHVYQPDAFLSYMSGTGPRLVSNDAGAVAPNTLHVVRIHPLSTLTGDSLATLWHTSLCRLSAEIEGHSLGGGMLKLEPTEAAQLSIPFWSGRSQALAELVGQVDSLLRSGREEAAYQQADAVILKAELGLSSKECRLLAEAADALRQRRYSRGSAA
ncbi:MAG: N-6 DNA methylase [Phycisphaerae bacterium]|nr:N-6 DNA methylase [Phycisphaerae bacterium]